MTKKFNFNDENILHLDLCGKEYSVALTPEVLANGDEVQRGVGELLKKHKDAAENSREALREMCEYCAEGIDKILGKGAAGEIFGERAVSLPDLADLLNFILTEMYEALDSATERYRGGVGK